MNDATSVRWILSLLFCSLVAANPAFAQSSSGGGSGSGSGMGSGATGVPYGGSGKTIKPKAGLPDDTARGQEQPGKQSRSMMQERTQSLEERLRAGQMDQPVAQGQISDRLNRLYQNSDMAVAGQSSR